MNQSYNSMNRSVREGRRENQLKLSPLRPWRLAAALILLLTFFLTPLSIGQASDEGGYWRLVETIEEPGDSSFESYWHGVLCSSHTASWSDGQVTNTVDWPATPRDVFYNCENNRNMTFSGVATWTPPPAVIYPDTEIPHNGRVTITARDTVWPGSIYWTIWRNTIRICGINAPVEGSASCEESYFTVGAGDPQAGERGTRLEISVQVSVTGGVSTPSGERMNAMGRYNYVYEWTPPPEAPAATTEPLPTTEAPPEERPITIEGTVTIPNPEWYSWSPELLGLAAAGVIVRVPPANTTIPLPDVVVTLQHADNILARTFTDMEGRFTFRDVFPAEDLTINVVLQHAIHAPNDPPYFQIVYNQQNQPIRISTHPFTIDEETDDPLVKEIRLHEPGELIASPADLQPDQYVNAGMTYYYTRQSWRMAALILGQPLDLAPLNVRIYSSLPHSPTAGAYWHGPIERRDRKFTAVAPIIELDPAYSNFRWYNRRGVILHEFGHHLMADSYGNFMPRAANDVGHAGFTNPSTTDSWVEGFATFFAAWTQRDSLNLADAHIWRDGPAVYNLEVNRLAWSESYGEEFAVASLLWDLLDPIDPRDCTYLPVADYASRPVITATATIAYCDYVQIDSNELWQILSGAGSFSMRSSSPGAPDGYPYIFDMVDLYEALKAHYFFYAGDRNLPLTTPNGLDPIDELFIAHGFFADVNPQNLAYDLAEEIGFTNNMTLTIGTDSFPPRMPRRSPPPTPNSYIGYELYDAAAGANIPPAPSDYFLVEVLFDAPYEHYNYSYETRSGEPGRLLYIGPPAHYPARARITALVPDYMPVGELEFTNEFYWQRMAEQPAGTFLNHTFVFESAYGYGVDQTLPRLLLAIIGFTSMCGCLLLLVGAAAIIFWRSRRK